MRRAFFAKMTAALAAAGLGARAIAQSAPAADGKGKTVRVVYQLSEGIDQAVRAVGNIRNHLAGAPDTRIVVVALGYGVDFLLEGARDSRGNGFDGPVSALAKSGVEFRVCRNTLVSRKIDENRVLMESKIIPAGVVEIANLQFNEGFAYIKP